MSDTVASTIRFKARAVSAPKEPDYPSENQDAWSVEDDGRRIAIADGVSGAFDSGAWAKILCKCAKTSYPTEDLSAWLEEARAEFCAYLDTKSLDFIMQRKLQAVGGGHTTLLVAELCPGAKEQIGYAGDSAYDAARTELDGEHLESTIDQSIGDVEAESAEDIPESPAAKPQEPWCSASGDSHRDNTSTDTLYPCLEDDPSSPSGCTVAGSRLRVWRLGTASCS